MSDQPPIESLLAEISNAIKANLPYAALMIALSVPDVCVTLQQDKPRADPDSYAEWVRKYLLDGKESPTGRMLYKLRCGVLHNAKGTHQDMKHFGFDRVIFTPPDSVYQVDGIVLNGAATFSAERFCERMIAAARKWYEENKSDPRVIENEDGLFRVRPRGLPDVGNIPFIG